MLTLGPAHVEKVWGWEEILVNTAFYCLKRIFIKPMHCTSIQIHRIKDETLFPQTVQAPLLLRLFTDDEKPRLTQQISLNVGEGFRVSPDVIHQLVNPDVAFTLCLLEVSSHHDDTDVIRPCGLGGKYEA